MIQSWSLVTCHCSSHLRGGAPGPFFFTLGFREPRGSVCLGWGGRFLRAARFSFFLSVLSLIFRVSIAPFQIG